MKIYILDKVLEFENNKIFLDNIFDEIEDILSEASEIIDYIVVDNVKIYEDFYNYFFDKINEIEKVEVITQTYKELVNSILISTMDYVVRTPNKIEELANSFYKNPSQDSWKDFRDLLDGISWIINTFTMIDQDKRLKDVVSSYENWNIYAEYVFTLKEVLLDFEDALMNADHVLIADILSYEIVSVFKKMSIELANLANREDGIDDVN